MPLSECLRGKARARFAVILGAEMAEGAVTVKDLDGGSQVKVPLADVVRHIAEAPRNAGT